MNVHYIIVKSQNKFLTRVSSEHDVFLLHQLIGILHHSPAILYLKTTNKNNKLTCFYNIIFIKHAERF